MLSKEREELEYHLAYNQMACEGKNPAPHIIGKLDYSGMAAACDAVPKIRAKINALR
jgi:hypothetical protein